LVSRADFCATGAVELALGCSSSLVWLFFSGRATGRGSAGVPPLLPAATSSSLVCTTGCRSSVASATTESAAGFPCSPTCISSVVYRPARGGTGTWCSHCQLKSKALAVVGGTGFEPVLKLQALRLVIRRAVSRPQPTGVFRMYWPCILKRNTGFDCLWRPGSELSIRFRAGPGSEVVHMFRIIGIMLPLMLAGLIAPHLSGQQVPLNMTISVSPNGPLYSPNTFEVDVYLTPTNTGGVWPSGMVQPTGSVEFTGNGNFWSNSSLRAAGYAFCVYTGSIMPADLPLTIVASYPETRTMLPSASPFHLPIWRERRLRKSCSNRRP